MKLLHKIIFNSAVALALVPASMQANGVRAMAKPGVMKAAVKLLKNPSVVMAGLGAASIAYARQSVRHCEESNHTHVGNYGGASCEDRAIKFFTLGTGLLGGSVYYSLLPQLIKKGYVSKLSNKTALIAAGLSFLGGESIRAGLVLKKDDNLTDLGKQLKDHYSWFILGGAQAIVLSGMYLGLA